MFLRFSFADFRYTTVRKIYPCLALALLVLFVLTGCYAETYEAVREGASGESSTTLVLTVVSPKSTSTRAASDDPDGYEKGIEWENSIDVEGGDYKIYFFSYSAEDSDGGRLLIDFTPERVYSSSTSSQTRYMILGTVPSQLMDASNFRVVVLANWGTYPSTTIGVTTIDDLVEGQYTTFSAADKFVIDEEKLIPFYGVQEYTGITFVKGSTTALPTEVNLLRAVAKVEVIMRANSDVESFEGVTLENYNSTGYCAPAGVYLSEDYDTKMEKNPETSSWGDEWVSSLHLLNNANDEGSKSQAFTHISGTTLDTWRIYVPEYDNTSDEEDFSYITLVVEGTEYPLYFAEYDEEGKSDNAVGERYDIKRNNIYRFYVTRNPFDFNVVVEVFPWVERLDNVEF